MEKMTLSLKNLYKVLMTNDFPIYSESVIGEKGRKGQTVLRFWQRQLVDHFRTQTYGKMIWRNDGKRNRYTSHLCNRSSELKCYSEYAREIASGLSEQMLTNQIVQFSKFLSDKDYRHDILIRRIGEFIRLCETEDLMMTPEIAARLKSGLEMPAALQRTGTSGNLFQAAYLLTILTCYAAAGDAMNSPALATLLEETYSLEQIWDYSSRNRDTDKRMVHMLTVPSAMLEGNVLPANRFFGREEALYDLTEAASHGQKWAVTGMGGVGKTEVLRQLLRRCRENHLVDHLAVVPYERTLAESFLRSFPGCGGLPYDEAVYYGFHRIAESAQSGKVLLVLDNVTGTLETDPDLQRLLNLPCAVLITSRHTVWNGFEQYPLELPSEAAGALIFRDNYEKPLDREDRKLLENMLKQELICHPLTLRLIGRAARSKSLTLRELKEYLENRNVSLFWHDGDRTVELRKVYQNLYSLSRAPEDCRNILELFTLLPRASYSAEFLTQWFPALFSSDSEEKLAALTEGGWLERDDSGWSMHPLIAQCLRRRVITESRIGPVLRHIQTHLQGLLPQEGVVSDDSVIHRICYIVRHISEFMSGSVSREWFNTVVFALYNADKTAQFKEKASLLLDRFESRCTEQDDESRIAALNLRCNLLLAEQEQYVRAYESQKKNRTVSEPLYLEMCLNAGYCALFQHSNYPLAEEMLREVLNGPSISVQKAWAYSYLVTCSNSAGKTVEAAHWAEEGYRFIQAHPECGDLVLCKLLSLLCQIYCIREQQEAAAELSPELKKRLREISVLDHQYYLLIALVSYESNYGSLDEAWQYQQRVMEIIENLRGKSLDYYVEIGSSALLLQRMKRHEESLEMYREAIGFYQAQKDTYWIQNLCGNASVTCLEMGQPEKALAFLDEGYGYASEIGGFDLAAFYYRYSGAYGQLGDVQKEYSYLKQSIPGFEEVFGESNPRCVKARERLAELELLIGK